MQSVYICDIEMGSGVQSLEESTSFALVIGNEPVTKAPADKENNEHEINNGTETVNNPPSHSKDEEFDIPNVQVSVSSFDEEGFLHYG